MHNGLNFGTIQKAVSTEAPTSGLVIEKLEDLLLVLKIYSEQDKYHEALAILDNDRFGIESKVGNNAWELVRLRVDLLGRSNRREEQWAYCRTLLVGALPDHLRDKLVEPFNCIFGKMGDDWAIWDGLIAAAHALDGQE